MSTTHNASNATAALDGPSLIASLVARLGAPARRLVGQHWIYTTAGGVATLNRGDDAPLKRLGAYKTEALARAACEAHFERACRGLSNLGQRVPTASFA